MIVYAGSRLRGARRSPALVREIEPRSAGAPACVRAAAPPARARLFAPRASAAARLPACLGVCVADRCRAARRAAVAGGAFQRPILLPVRVQGGAGLEIAAALDALGRQTGTCGAAGARRGLARGSAGLQQRSRRACDGARGPVVTGVERVDVTIADLAAGGARRLQRQSSWRCRRAALGAAAAAAPRPARAGAASAAALAGRRPALRGAARAAAPPPARRGRAERATRRRALGPSIALGLGSRARLASASSSAARSSRRARCGAASAGAPPKPTARWCATVRAPGSARPAARARACAPGARVTPLASVASPGPVAANAKVDSRSPTRGGGFRDALRGR